MILPPLIFYVSMNGMELVTTSINETNAIAKQFVEKLLTAVGSNSPTNEATVVGLYGDLGAGKTAFTKGIAKALGITDEITSPTFVIEKIYPLTNNTNYDRLIHIDAYRLERSEELLHLGWKDITHDPRNLILIEWQKKWQVLCRLLTSSCILLLSMRAREK